MKHPNKHNTQECVSQRNVSVSKTELSSHVRMVHVYQVVQRCSAAWNVRLQYRFGITSLVRRHKRI